MAYKEMEEKIEDVLYRYRKKGYGDIAKFYSIQEEQEVYKKGAQILSKKYGDIISKEEIYEILSRRGRIYTMKLNNRMAFFEIKTANIGIPHFLDRFTETLLHELVHKLGFEECDESFKNMSQVFKEAGTEIVAGEALSNNTYGREVIFRKTFSKYPEKVDDSFLEVCLVNQINTAIGGKNLEKSILKGRDYFKPAIIEQWGEETYVFLKENIEDLSRMENKFWKDYEFFSEDERCSKEDELRKRIYLIQDTILESEFNKRFSKITSKSEADKFLKELLEFEENRVRIKETSDDEKIFFKDLSFIEYFNKYKNELQKKYGNIDLEFDESAWQKKYKNKKILNEVTEDEKTEVALMALEFRKKYKKRGAISQFFDKLFKKPQKLLEQQKDEKFMNKEFKQYKVEKLPQYEETDKRENKSLEDRSL